MNVDLFGQPVLITPEDLRHGKRRRRGVANGYARPPGSGPAGETCGTCAHHRVKIWAGRYHKCALVKPTKGAGTDIRVRSPACSRWEKRP